MLAAGDTFSLAQDEVLRWWNEVGQRGEAPRFTGTGDTWRSHFRQHLEALVSTPVDQAPPALLLFTPQPRGY